MKKVFCLLLVLFTTMLLVACTNDDNSEDEPDPIIPSLELNLSKNTINIGQSVDLSVNVLNLGELMPKYTITTTSTNITIDGTTIFASAIGDATIKVKLDDFNVEASIVLKVVDEDRTAPEFVLECDKDVMLNWNVEFDPLAGVKAIDANDGDITSKITVEGSVDNQVYGDYTLKYSVTDYSGNTATLERKITVYWGYKTKFIGHAGCYYGVQNSEEAFLYAVQVLHYQALECDLSRTKDGVFVMCHDQTFGGVNISSKTYKELSEVVATSSRKSGYPKELGELKTDGQYSTHICTLERYLEICKEYNATAIIELKGCTGITQQDQTGMQALMDFIESKDMLNNVTFLASAYNCLIWVKQHGYEYIPCQYLVDGCCKQEYLDRCIQYGFDLSVNVTYSTVDKNMTTTQIKEWMDKYKAAGCKISLWTFTQYCSYEQVQEWIDYGVDYVTCDWYTMSNLKHYEIEK